MNRNPRHIYPSPLRLSLILTAIALAFYAAMIVNHLPS